MAGARNASVTAAIAVATAMAAPVLLAACSDSAPPPSRPPAQVVNPSPSPGHALSAADWPTYDHDAGRSAAAPGVPPPGKLTVAWHRQLDGAVYGQPLIIGHEIIAATEGGTIYALRADGGQEVWHRHIADPVPLSDLPCGNIDPLGITGTPVYDPASGLVFAVTETTGGRHILAGVSLATGRLAVQREVEPPRGDRLATQQRPALTLRGGRVYIAFGGLEGDCGQYVGSVVSVATSGRGPVDSYAVPTKRMAGMWATGGVVAAGDRLFVSAGNGASTSTFDGSDSVTALSADLRRVDIFAPSSWAADNASDADLGSMTPAVTGAYVFIAGKNGTGYVLRAARLGGVGGEVAKLEVCNGFGTGAVVGPVVYVPCGDTGIKQVTIGADGTPRPGWTAQASSAHGSPVTGGGAVWVVDYDGGVLYALDAANGTIKARVEVGKAPHFASLSLSGSHAYVGVLDGVVAVSGA
ncbi:MAG: PQQ-binding-like beta-propeller repeat protein [Micromonosporaceae bacterium]